MGRRRRVRTRALLPVAVVVSLVATSGLVWQASHAAFTSRTGNDGNQITTGTVRITDTDSGSAMFPVGGPLLRPGDQGSACITVTYEGSVVGAALAPVRLRLAQRMDSGSASGFAPEVLWSVERGTGTPGTGTTCPSSGVAWATVYPSSAAPSPLPGASKATVGAKTMYDFAYGGETTPAAASRPAGSLRPRARRGCSASPTGSPPTQ